MKKKKRQSKDNQKLVKPSNDTDPKSQEQKPDQPIVSQNLIIQFLRFYEYHPAGRLSRNLRSLVLEFLMYDGSAEAEYLRDLVVDLDGLFSLLDEMEEEARLSKV
jgi:hypothetical protein